MGEKPIAQIAKRLAGKEKIENINDIRGTGYITRGEIDNNDKTVECFSYEKVTIDKQAYAEAAMLQHNEHDPVRGRKLIQECNGRKLVINPPQPAPSAPELDKIYSLPYTREVHPMYKSLGGVPAIEEVRFSVIHNRGCFGACNFCALAFHQGKVVASRSHASVIAEAEKFAAHPEFKGFIHDVGGPTANMRNPSCKQQLTQGMCKNKNCLIPPCENLDTGHSDYLALLRKLANIQGVKKVFIRSGIRFDFMMLDKKGDFFAGLVKNHISGQLKVAPEHSVDTVLDYMGKPKNKVFEKFIEKYKALNLRYGKDQYLVPYLLAGHPGCTLSDSIKLAEYLNKQGRQPEQVQLFYPTPGTLSTCMYYTGLDPRTMKPVYIPRSSKEKSEQRMLMQWKKPENREAVYKILKKSGRDDLIGFGKRSLVKPQRKSGR